MRRRGVTAVEFLSQRVLSGFAVPARHELMTKAELGRCPTSSLPQETYLRVGW